MAWFSAHLLMRIEIKGNPEAEPIDVFENVVLFSGNDANEAMEKANTRGAQAEGDSAGSLTWEGKPARRKFEGLRKLISVDRDLHPAVDGVEVTYSEFRLATKQELAQLVNGEEVILTYEP